MSQGTAATWWRIPDPRRGPNGPKLASFVQHARLSSYLAPPELASFCTIDLPEASSPRGPILPKFGFVSHNRSPSPAGPLSEIGFVLRICPLSHLVRPGIGFVSHICPTSYAGKPRPAGKLGLLRTIVPGGGPPPALPATDHPGWRGRELALFCIIVPRVLTSLPSAFKS
jgi:hypothetical protein